MDNPYFPRKTNVSTGLASMLVYCYQRFMYEDEHYVQSKISFSPGRANT